MITLDNFENFVPYKILMRGEEYYDTCLLYTSDAADE